MKIILHSAGQDEAAADGSQGLCSITDMAERESARLQRAEDHSGVELKLTASSSERDVQEGRVATAAAAGTFAICDSQASMQLATSSVMQTLQKVMPLCLYSSPEESISLPRLHDRTITYKVSLLAKCALCCVHFFPAIVHAMNSKLYSA